MFRTLEIYNRTRMTLFQRLALILGKSSSDKPFNGSLGNTILAFQQTLQKSIDWKELKDMEFAMWLPCETDRIFSTSPLVAKWTSIYALTKHHWTYLAADLLKTLRLIQDDTFRLELPEQFQSFAFLTSTHEQAIISLSQEKGIRFHFAETSSLAMRLTFLEHFCAYCQAWAEWIELNKGELDPDIGCAAWWEATVTASVFTEKSEPIKAVGKIVK